MACRLAISRGSSDVDPFSDPIDINMVVMAGCVVEWGSVYPKLRSDDALSKPWKRRET